jgi:hypothetical protein
VISHYLDSLSGALSLDRSLARCVRQEVEDHLHEAVAADPSGDRVGAERRAISNFGDPYAIAAQFAVISLAKQTRRVGAAVILVIAGVFIAMRARVAWYAVTQWVMCEDLEAVRGIVGLIDRYSFWLSVIIGVGSFAYISVGRIPQSFYPAYYRQLRCFFLLCTAATGALVISVTSDAALTALELFGTKLPTEFLVPVFSMAIEIICAGVLVFQIRSMTQQTAATAALLKV